MVIAASQNVHELDAYWSAVVTTVPVLALAAVLEVRRNVTHWSARWRARRVTDAVIYGGYVLALTFSFVLGLSALAYGGLQRFIPIVNLAMGGAVGIVILAPILSIAVKGNSDIGTIIFRYVPFTPAARLRRHARKARKIILPTLLSALAQLERSEQLKIDTAGARRIAQEALDLSRKQLKVTQGIRSSPKINELVNTGKRLVQTATQNLDSARKNEVEAEATLEESWDIFLRIEHNYTKILRIQRIIHPWHVTPKVMSSLDRTIVGLRDFTPKREHTNG